MFSCSISRKNSGRFPCSATSMAATELTSACTRCSEATAQHGPARSNSAGDVGEIKPHLHSAKMRTFRANRSGDFGAKMAGRADISRELRMHLSHLGDFIE